MKLQVPSHVATRLASLLLIFAAFSTHGQSQLIKDVNRTEAVDFNEYSDFTRAGSTMYFVSLGKELWKSNGTSGGTIRLKSLTAVSNLTAVGNILYFVGTDGSGAELWKTDGASTVRVKDIRAGSSGSSPSQLVDVNGTLYFIANDGKTGVEVWKSNGTSTGTLLVKDIFPGTGSSSPSRLTNVNGTLYFNANDNTNGYELWKSNGTASGTLLVKNINPGTKASSHPQLLTNLNGTLYFTATDGSTGQELWKSNGTSAGTVRVKDIYPGVTGSSIDNITAVGDVIMFSATNGTNGKELWKSNGTSAGTVLVKDITPGAESSFTLPGGHNFTAINGALYFTSGQYGADIMRSDGTSAGTKVITRAIEPGLDNPVITRFTLHNGSIYFFNHMVDYYYPYYGLYKMDLNGNNVTLVKQLWLGDPQIYEYDYYASYRTNIVSANNILFVSGRLQQTQGTKLLRSDGTAAGTVVVKDAFIQTFGSSPDLFTKTANGKVFFRANGRLGHDEYYQELGQDLWVTDGTAAGTVELKRSESLSQITAVGNKVFFSGPAENDDPGLWVSDGTPAGTIKLHDTSPFTAIEFKGLLYFNDYNELWRSDGTAGGTIRVQTMPVFIEQLHKLDTKLLITTSTSSNGVNLYSSDGTSAPTLIKTFSSYNSSYRERDFVNAKGYAYFIADNGTGDELWRTNGTASGTTVVTELRTNDQNDADFAGIQMFRDSIYFSAQDDTGAWALFKTNGTASSTKKLGNVNPVYEYAASGTSFLLMFPEKPAGTGNDEVWSTRGTASTTKKLKDLPGAHLPDVSAVTINDVVYFSVNFFRGIVPRLWRSDGTACGTFDFNIGASSPYPLTSIGTNIIFGGNNPRELYKYSAASAPASPCGTPTFATALDEVIVMESEDIIRSSPNPFQTDLTLSISGNDNEDVKAIIYTSTGSPFEAHENLKANTTYTLGHTWPSGLYIIRASIGPRVVTKKVIKE